MTKKTAILLASVGAGPDYERDAPGLCGSFAAAFPEHEIRSCCINEFLRRKYGGESVPGALQRLRDDGFGRVLIQPVCIGRGTEYRRLAAEADMAAEHFDSVMIGAPMLDTQRDFAQAVSCLPECREPDRAMVAIGHGTGEPKADEIWRALERELCPNAFVATIKGSPSVSDALEKLKRTNARQALLVPFVIASGEHTRRDIAGEGEHSVKSAFQRAGYGVSCVMEGLGKKQAILDIFIRHTAKALSGDGR